MEIINTRLDTIFYCRADIFKYLHFPSTITSYQTLLTDTSHIPSTIALPKYLST